MKKTLLSLVLLAGLAGGGWLLTESPAKTAGSVDGCVAHEWGTFTSVQGGDGEQLSWNPQVAPDLPKFVYHQQNIMKFRLVMRQRMETPVLYFYSDRERTLDVSIKFPEGFVTEWYPLPKAVDPQAMPGEPLIKPALHWPKLKVLPATAAGAAALPKDATVSHYYAARETDASLLQVRDGEKTETEKFLFYRGVAGFQAPLTVKMDLAHPASVTLQNTSTEPLAHLFLYQVTAQGGAWLRVPALTAGATTTVALPKDGAPFAELAPALRAALVAEGLYEKEAAAMVKTWEDAWFQERGLRVLYTLPRAWTDRTLPLQITPSAAKIERVMVGRAEILTPALEQSLVGLIEQYRTAPEAKRPALIQEVLDLGFGRFFVTAMYRARGHTPGEGYEGAWLDVHNAVLWAMTPKPAVTAQVETAR